MELETLIADVERTKGRDVDCLVQFLRHVRANGLRCSALVAKWGGVALDRHKSRLGDDYWAINELVLIAALDVHDEKLASKCEETLCRRFETGARISRLKGMCAESRGEFELASETYTKMLEENAANGAAMRREICVRRAEAGLDVSKEIVEAFNDYIGKFQSDFASWQALAETYTRAAQWAYAIFCYEELILFEPLAHHYHCRLGELHYTTAAGSAGKKQQMATLRLARKYLAQSLELAKAAPTVRAATGLLLCCSQIARCASAKDTDDSGDLDLNAALAGVASSRIKALYKKDAPGLAPFVAPVLVLHAPPYTTTKPIAA